MGPSRMNEGLYQKFRVSRVDGRDRPGGDKDNARYFVLDIANDEYAREALATYAYSCRASEPELSADLYRLLEVCEGGNRPYDSSEDGGW